mmetsp:Transcript_40136/g.66298  ORF Transcript_40136/g.66298 Transcript_40136/m.66298 type:complete len:397 (+) Transcript_40136:133-1323(+)
MRSWAAGPLSRRICRAFIWRGGNGSSRSCASGGKSDGIQRSLSHKEDAATTAADMSPESLGPGLLPDEPILADFLAMGAAAERMPGDAAPADELHGAVEAQTSSGAASTKLQPDSSHVVAAQPSRERRLVGAALRPAVALPKAPSAEKPSWRPIDAGDLRWAPRSLPGLFERSSASTEQADAEERLNASADISAAGLSQTRSAMPQASTSDAEQPMEPAPGREYVAEQRPLGFAAAANTNLRAMRASARVPRSLRQKLCKFLFGSFSQAKAAEAGDASMWAQVLTPWETEQALRHCGKGAVMALVRHLAETELHMEKGVQRQSLSRPQDGDPELLQSERRELTRGWWASHAQGLAEDALIALFLDRRLSWSRVRALLVYSEKPPMVTTRKDDDAAA